MIDINKLFSSAFCPVEKTILVDVRCDKCIPRLIGDPVQYRLSVIWHEVYENGHVNIIEERTYDYHVVHDYLQFISYFRADKQ